MKVGDRVRIANYKDDDGKAIEIMIGLLGTVDYVYPEHVDVYMDDEIGGTNWWMFEKTNLEVV